MSNINKILVGSTTYDITPSSDGTFEGTSDDVADGSATSWTTVATLTTGETNGSIFTKISNMFKNIRYLYSRLGTTDIIVLVILLLVMFLLVQDGKLEINIILILILLMHNLLLLLQD